MKRNTKKWISLLLTVVMAFGYIGLTSGVLGLDPLQTAITAKAESEAEAWNRAVIEAFSGYTVSGTRSGELAQSTFIVIAAAHSSQYSWDGSFDGSGYAQGRVHVGDHQGHGVHLPERRLYRKRHAGGQQQRQADHAEGTLRLRAEDRVQLDVLHGRAAAGAVLGQRFRGPVQEEINEFV